MGTEISKALYESWTNRRPYEREKTCENRTNLLSQFYKFVIRMGGRAYAPPVAQRLHRDISYRPYIFTNEELSRFLECAKQKKHEVKPPIQLIIEEHLSKPWQLCLSPRRIGNRRIWCWLDSIAAFKIANVDRLGAAAL